MRTVQPLQRAAQVTLQAETAADLMTPNPLSIEDGATIREAVAFLVDRRITGAAVIDAAGRPVGVVSQTDLLIHDRENAEHLAPPEHETGAPLPPARWAEFQLERVDTTPVREVMTPAIFAVAGTESAWKVVEELCRLSVHRLFVVDGDGVLVGVISALDVLRRLRCDER